MLENVSVWDVVGHHKKVEYEGYFAKKLVCKKCLKRGHIAKIYQGKRKSPTCDVNNVDLDNTTTPDKSQLVQLSTITWNWVVEEDIPDPSRVLNDIFLINVL